MAITRLGPQPVAGIAACSASAASWPSAGLPCRTMACQPPSPPGA